MSLPIGAVICYAADNVNFLVGWQLCDGTGSTQDLRAKFLCGSTSEYPTKKGAFSSTAATWKSVGSQPQPVSIEVGVPRIPTNNSNVNKVDDKTMILWRDDTTSFQVAGGDSETRPKNIALNFIQKVSADAEIPLGAVIPVGAAEGVVNASQMPPWLKCDGEKSPRTDFPDLFTLLGTRYDVLAADRVDGYRPELRGLFIRGVLHDRDAIYDPDANTRNAADGTQGKSFTGTMQRFATNVKSWTVSIPHFPRTYEDDILRSDNSHMLHSDCLPGHNNMEAGDYHTSQRWTGFARETRPDNAAVNYYISGRNGATFPVSGIIATMNVVNDPSWLLCDGSLVARKEYPELCQRINYAWGGFKDTHCNLPDLSGRFLRGADGRDPRMDGPLVDQQLDNDRFQRYRVGISPESVTVFNTWGAGSLQDSAIGLPEAWRNTQGAVVATETNKAGVGIQRVDLEPSLDANMELGTPSNGIAANVPHSSHTNAFGVQGHYVSQRNGDTVWTGISSGDSITAPTRTYVNYYIKARP